MGTFAGFRREDANATRQRVAEQVIRWAVEQGANALVLPAGFLRARKDGREFLLRAAEPLTSVARELHIAITVGVDACGPDWEEHFPRDPVVSEGALPYFAVSSSTREEPPQVLRQRSTTNANWQLAPEKANREVHLTATGPMQIGIVLSGEVFSVPVRRGLAAACPAAVMVAAHWAAVGCRQWSVMAHLGKLGIPVVRAAHAKAGATNVLWKGPAKIGPIVEPAHFQQGAFNAFAHVFEV